MTTETTLRLAHDCENIVAVKEASGNLTQVAQIIDGAPTGFEVLSGDDEMTLPLMGLGGAGVISVLSHVAGDRFKEMIDAQVAGDHTRALRIHLELLPLMKALFMTANPIMVKEALRLQGFDVGGVRLPLVEPTAEQTAELERVMRHVGALA
jgi:4-hydroxy-tetrahydrodipicolinate synthase